MSTRSSQGNLNKKYTFCTCAIFELFHLVGKKLGGGGEGGEEDPPEQLALHGDGEPVRGKVVGRPVAMLEGVMDEYD